MSGDAEIDDMLADLESCAVKGATVQPSSKAAEAVVDDGDETLSWTRVERDTDSASHKHQALLASISQLSKAPSSTNRASSSSSVPEHALLDKQLDAMVREFDVAVHHPDAFTAQNGDETADTKAAGVFTPDMFAEKAAKRKAANAERHTPAFVDADTLLSSVSALPLQSSGGRPAAQQATSTATSQQQHDMGDALRELSALDASLGAIDFSMSGANSTKGSSKPAHSSTVATTAATDEWEV